MNQESWHEYEGKHRVDFLPMINPEEPYAVESVVLARIPISITIDDVDEMIRNFWEAKCLPIVFSESAMSSLHAPKNFWPTDEWRTIGRHIVYTNITTLNMVEQILVKEASAYPQFHAYASQIRDRRVYTPFSRFGHDCLVLESLKKAVIATRRISFHDDMPEHIEELDRFINWLYGQGYSIESVDISNLSFTDRMTIADLDFLFYPFLGKDGQPHALVAESFVPNAPDSFHWHVVPDDEASRGGCNIADCGDGDVLIIPNRVDAPNTFSILQKFSYAERITELPMNFMEGGGGPRCLISTMPITAS